MARTEVKATGDATAQAAKPLATTTPTATTTSKSTETGKRAVETTIGDVEQKKSRLVEQKPTTHPADALDARVVPTTRLPVQSGKATEDTTTVDPSFPPAAHGAAHAAAHSSVVQRAVWARLDTDADGRISATEADADAMFDGDFATIDVDADGFVSDGEYRTFAKADSSQGTANAAAHSSVVKRDTWSRLDTDGDGRISANEADADAGIDGSFSATDSNGDGFVTDAEFRAHAKAASKP